MPRHKVVYYRSGRYAGWPANHGAWQDGDKFLVGFLEGPYKKNGGMHNIGKPRSIRFSYSDDGGQSWSLRPLTEQFLSSVKDFKPAPEWIKFNGQNIFRFSGNYDHGGEHVAQGGFYASRDFGETWDGPFRTDGAWITDEYSLPTSRTAYLPNGIVFQTIRMPNIWGSDRTACTRWRNGKFEFLGYVGDDSARCVMPAAVQAGDFMFVALRRRNYTYNWIEIYKSLDGDVWSSVGTVGSSGRANGNPPALLTLDDENILCVWGDRSEAKLMGRVLNTASLEFKAQFVVRETTLRKGRYFDFGYPRLLRRSDNTPICVYYWIDEDRPYQHIAASEITVQ